MKGYMRDNSFVVKMKNYNTNSDEHGLAVRFLGITLTLMLMWLLFWVLVLKMCNHESLILNYTNLREMTIEERIMWDLVPFNYRGEGLYKLKQILSTVLNCFVLAPLGVTLCYSFKRVRVIFGAFISLVFITLIEATQLLTTFGNLATEDFITNFISYFVGLLIYLIFFRRLSEKATVRMLSVFVIIGVALTAYTVMTTINSAELIVSLINRTY